MERAVIVRGRMTKSTRIDLEEPVDDIEGEVEVTVRAARPSGRASKESVFDFIKRLPGGARSKEDIDRQIDEERSSWERDR
jgi:hypothetical protein